MRRHLPLIIVLALLMAFYGGALFGALGTMTGLAVGVLAGLQLMQFDRLRQLEQRIDRLGTEQAQPARPVHMPRGAEAPRGAQTSRSTESRPVADADFAVPVPPAGPAATEPPRATEAPTSAPQSAAAATPVTPAVSTPAARPRRPIEKNAIERGIEWLKHYMTTGNVVAKVGVLLLFFGVAFLLKYAIDRNRLPIELRLIGTALGAIALILTGWRLRARRKAFGLILQGGGVGLLYLTVFAAARLYHVLPLPLTFLVLLLLVAFSGVLAVLQDSRALAILGAVGGFLAPVLTSTGGGSHVALFSYYAVLNLGIVGIAWFRAWRLLNLVGFAFTFVIGAAWGWQYYQPRHFASTEPFLILSFFFYLAVSVLFAHRHPPRLRGYVDGTLVFGLPLVCFSLQAPMVREIEFGRAWTALAMGIVYLSLARWLWGKRIEHMRMLVEAQLALGVIALSLAIPFAFDGHITAAGWALEGAGIVWIGIRQQRPLARAFGSLLLIGAGCAFFFGRSADNDVMPVLNAGYLGSVLVALGALLAGYLLHHAREHARPWEGLARVVLLCWGLAWWFGAGLNEIDNHVAWRFQDAADLVFVAASVAALAQIAPPLAWTPATRATALWPPLLGLLALSAFMGSHGTGPLAELRWLGWLGAVAAAHVAMQRARDNWSMTMQRAAHAVTWWSLLLLLGWACYWWLDGVSGLAEAWAIACWGLVPAAAMVMLLRVEARLPWPVGAFRRLYLMSAQWPVVFVVLLWLLVASTDSGAAAPLPRVPLLNPLDLAQFACLLMLLRWWLAVCADSELQPTVDRELGPIVLGGAFFFWLNVATARAVHFIADVPYALGSLHRSPVFQGSISVLWGVLALVVMVSATRIGRRTLWRVGAALLALLVLKLVFVDLAGRGTVARIVSFMAAGGLMMLIGYLSPAPPEETQEKDRT